MTTEYRFKICFKCNVNKVISDFYKHKEMLDGYLNKCKSCARKDSTNHRHNNIEKIRAYDRNRPNKEQRLELVKASSKTPKGILIQKRAKLKWSKENKEKVAAHRLVRRSIRNGSLKKEPCFCGRKAEAHHEDYSMPLKVIWLCDPHHKQRHNELRRMKRLLDKKTV